MSTLQSVMDALQSKGNEKTRIIYSRHGIPIERTFGVSNADLKQIAKTIKKEQALALELYGTGNMDAMYLAGIVADGGKMTREQLQAWAEGAKELPIIMDHTVPWVTVENLDGPDIAWEWIHSPESHVATCGWRTYSGLLATKPDDELNLAQIGELLALLERDVHGADNRVRSAMNNFVVSVGTHVQPLSENAKESANRIGVVYVDVGETACKVPVAAESIAKIEAAGKMGQKRKTIRC